MASTLERLGEPAGDRCRVCDSTLDGTGRCTACGAVWGERHRCPHCGAVAPVEEGGDAPRCRLCGGPRLPVGEALSTSGAEVALLREARQHRARARLFFAGAAALVALAGAPLVLALGMGLFGAGVAAGLLLALAALPAGGAFLAARAGQRARARGVDALDAAQSSVTRDLLRARGSELTSRELAAALGVGDARAELLLARLHAEDAVKIRVSDEGQVLYRVQGARLRLDADETEHDPDAEAGLARAARRGELE